MRLFRTDASNRSAARAHDQTRLRSSHRHSIAVLVASASLLLGATNVHARSSFVPLSEPLNTTQFAKTKSAESGSSTQKKKAAKNTPNEKKLTPTKKTKQSPVGSEITPAKKTK